MYYSARFMLINVNENIFVSLLIQLNLIDLSKAGLVQIGDSLK